MAPIKSCQKRRFLVMEVNTLYVNCTTNKLGPAGLDETSGAGLSGTSHTDDDGMSSSPDSGAKPMGLSATPLVRSQYLLVLLVASAWSSKMDKIVDKPAVVAVEASVLVLMSSWIIVTKQPAPLPKSTPLVFSFVLPLFIARIC
ncbi:hypothetical protein FRC07_001573 [Ceratobasidium sp. 392]|nr:hypothetical protein FRC07_001573 [Ceratobasidium sp. 392]